MTHQEMVDQVSDELRNVSITSKITRWLNMSIVDLGTKYIFGHLNVYYNAPTVSSNPDWVLPTDFLWLKTIQIPSTVTKIYPKDEQILAEENPDYRTLTGEITHYYINGTTLSFFRVPSGIVQVYTSYQKRPVKLVSMADVCDLPEEWHLLVIQKAITIGFRYEGNTEGKDSSEKAEARLLRGLGSNVYRRPDETLVTGSDPTSYQKPDRPRLGANPQYPGVRW